MEKRYPLLLRPPTHTTTPMKIIVVFVNGPYAVNDREPHNIPYPRVLFLFVVSFVAGGLVGLRVYEASASDWAPGFPRTGHAGTGRLQLRLRLRQVRTCFLAPPRPVPIDYSLWVLEPCFTVSNRQVYKHFLGAGLSL